MRVQTPRTPLYVISWTCSGYWVTRAHVFVSAGYQATVALREMKWKSGPTCKRDPWLRHRPISKCPLYRFETTGQLLHSEVDSNQVGCSCTWQRSLSRETNIGAPGEISAPYQSWRGWNHQTSNWPYEGHQIPYLVPRTTDYLSPLWSNTDHWA